LATIIALHPQDEKEKRIVEIIALFLIFSYFSRPIYCPFVATTSPSLLCEEFLIVDNNHDKISSELTNFTSQIYYDTIWEK
jgi:hypothetical protein